MLRSGCALVLAGVVLAGCGSGPTDEEQVRETVAAFGQATAHKDYRRLCEQLLAPKLIEQVKEIGLPCEQALAKGLGQVKDPRLSIGQIVVTGETASAEIRTSAANEKPSRDTLQLTKVNGRWRIASLG